jgi:hypothetical protein
MEPATPADFRDLERALDRMTRTLTVRFAWMMVGFVVAAHLIIRLNLP